MNEPTVEKISDTEFRLSYNNIQSGVILFPLIGMTFTYDGKDYELKEVVATNSDNFTFDVTVR